MSRPYSRRCKSCGKKFGPTRSNGRVYCFKCSPPQLAGRGRTDGGVSGTELPERSIVPEGERVEAEEPDENDKAAEEIASGKYAASVGKKKDDPDAVKTEGRPSEGWGQCKFKDPEDRKAATCPGERWSQTTPFCMKHVEWWQDRKAEQRSVELSDDDRRSQKARGFSQRSFNVRNHQEARTLLARINFAVYMGTISIVKAKALKEMVLAQIKALDSELIARKIAAKTGEVDDLLVVPDDETADADKALADEFGIEVPPEVPIEQEPPPAEESHEA